MSCNRRRRRLAAAVLTVATLGGGAVAHADDPLFGYLYTTDVLPQGKWEFEQQATLREGQSRGRFHDLELRTEAEYGLSNDLQVSGYLNTSFIDANRNSVTGLTQGLDIPGDHDPSRPYSAFRFDSVSAEVIWRVLSPYQDPIGLALYVEPELGPHERGLELRLIAHKTLLDDKLHLAANAWVEWEREVDHQVDPLTGLREEAIEKASRLEFDLGASYRVRPNWSVGLEYRNHNAFDGYGLDGSRQEHTAHFVGPNIHYAGQVWFMTLTALYQVHAAGYTAEQQAAIVDGRIYGDEHTRWDGLRLKVGRVFR